MFLSDLLKRIIIASKLYLLRK